MKYPLKAINTKKLRKKFIENTLNGYFLGDFTHSQAMERLMSATKPKVSVFVVFWSAIAGMAILTLIAIFGKVCQF